MATHSSILAWKIPWAEEPGATSPWGRKQVGHNLATKQQQKFKISVIFSVLFHILNG